MTEPGQTQSRIKTDPVSLITGTTLRIGVTAFMDMIDNRTLQFLTDL